MFLLKVSFTTILYLQVIMVQAMPSQYPIFSIQYAISGSGTEIRLNDIPVVYSDSTGDAISDKQVPESIVDGLNTLTILSFPLENNGNKYESDASIDVSLIMYEKDIPIEDGKVLLHMRLNPASTEYGETPKVFSHGDSKTVAGRQVAINSPFPRWAWQDGQIIENTAENYASLLEKYKEIWAALNEGDKDKVFALYDHAAREFATSYHYEKIESGHRLMDTGGFIENDGWTLGNINTILKNVKFGLKIYGNGKLAHIIDEDRDPSLITYLNKKVRMISTQKYSFYKNKNGKWIMIR